jgi:glutamate formiminotransferase
VQNLEIQDGHGRHLGFYQNVNNFRKDWAFWLQFEQRIPRHNRNWKISSKVQNFEKPKWRPTPSWIFANMLITSVRIELVGWNLNWIYLDTTQIGKFHQKWKILKMQDGGGRHLGFAKMLITSVRIELLGWNLNSVYLDTTEIGKFHQKCKILKIQDGGRRHVGFYQNVNNFRTDWAFWLQFQPCIP